MNTDDAYFSIDRESASESAVKGSRFIAHAAPASTKEQAEKYIDAISGRFKEATHNCFAYKIGVGDRAIFRFSDAGEPSGTAGRPILQAIEAKGLTNVAVVVTRYFGGTKLGTGGLIRAYNSSALEALKKAKIVKHYPQILLRLVLPYHFTNSAQHLIKKFAAHIVESQFDEQMVYLLKLKAIDELAFRERLQNASSGQIKIEKID